MARAKHRNKIYAREVEAFLNRHNRAEAHQAMLDSHERYKRTGKNDVEVEDVVEVEEVEVST